MQLGKFIVLEGQGFSGKTEQARLLSEKLRQKGKEVIETQEPGGVASAQAIRDEILKRKQQENITPEEEVQLFYKSRERFLHELVIPALLEGKWIVSTRFSASTFVYQGFVSGVDLKFIEGLEEKVVNIHQPDLYILIDVSEEEILKRITKEDKREIHGYNEADLKVIKKRREGYLNLAKENTNKNWVIVDGNKGLEDVAEQIWKAVSKLGFN